ncbi:MAG: hypothetical protein GKS07_05030 [Nitrosopumilus sp.]|nr:MAG: hypothetical protein GKS07_05030 [Nitrosopumilus sp.]
MSKVSQDSKDDSDVIDQVAKKYFLEMEHSVPHMQQVLFDFQNECYKTWKNTINANISLHKEFLDKSGLDCAISDSMKSLVGTVGDEALQYRTYCKNIAIANIESAKQNAKTLNDNAELFADLNRKTMQYWMSAFFPKRD